jgi:hypothetical protein
MELTERSPTEAKWNEALQHMLSALDVLDQSDAPDDIAPHLDMAIWRLEDALGCNPAENSVERLHTVIENALMNVSEGMTNLDASLWPSQAETAKPSGGDRPLLFR